MQTRRTRGHTHAARLRTASFVLLVACGSTSSVGVQPSVMPVAAEPTPAPPTPAPETPPGCRYTWSGATERYFAIGRHADGREMDGFAFQITVDVFADEVRVAAERPEWRLEDTTDADEVLAPARPFLVAEAFVPHAVHRLSAESGRLRVEVDPPEGVRLVHTPTVELPCDAVDLDPFEPSTLVTWLGGGWERASVSSPAGAPIVLRDARGDVSATLDGSRTWHVHEVERRDDRVRGAVDVATGWVIGWVDAPLVTESTADASFGYGGLGLRGVRWPRHVCAAELELHLGEEPQPVGRLRAGVPFDLDLDDSDPERGPWRSVRIDHVDPRAGSLRVRRADLASCHEDRPRPD